jgi:hypothetical protein
MQPSVAIMKHCRFCGGQEPGCFKCGIYASGTPLERIKAYCKQCACDHEPEICTEKLIGSQGKMMLELTGSDLCPLFPYRMGKSGRKMTAEQKIQARLRLQKHDFRKKEAFLDSKAYITALNIILR